MSTVGFCMFFFFSLWACTPRIIKYPGPLIGLGRERVLHERSMEAPQQERTEPKETKKTPPPKSSSFRKVPDAARSFLGKRVLKHKGKTYRYDCSGFVSAVYGKVGISIDGSVRYIYDSSKKKRTLRKEPRIGDLVFFDNTFDANKNGAFDDMLTHIAVVEKIESSGRITMIHLGSKGVVRIYMNLHHRDIYKDEYGVVQNSYLRFRKSKNDTRPRLAGQLWKRFAFVDAP